MSLHSVTANHLNLRSGPKPAPIIVTLPQGTTVEKLGESPAQPNWWNVTAKLDGQSVTGFVNSGFLSEGAGPELPAGPDLAIPECHLRPGGHTRRMTAGRASPLDEGDMPGRRAGSPGAAADVIAISRYLDPGNGAHQRYQPGGGLTFCNIYAYDFCARAGAFLPRVWWKRAALAAIGRGETVPVLYDNTVSELTANVLHDWFREFGDGFGWRRVMTADALQAGANAGEVAIIVAKRVNVARSGHILAVLPEHDGINAARDGGAVVRPVQSQAGAANFRAQVPPTRWWADSRFQSFGFWLHP